MAKYKAYPEYKDSGVEWLKAIPEHWKLSKLRYQFVFGKGLTITKEHLQDEGIPCVNYGEVHSKYGFEVDPEIHILKCVSDKYLKDNSSSLLGKGDIVFADTSEDIDGSGNFTQLVSDIVTFAGYHTIIARPFQRENSRFYAYLLDCKELRSQVRHAVKGVKVFSITQAILRNLSIWLPSKDEQAQIAIFLDHETAKIDNLIGKQNQLIELLKEKRQAVISHAVTKGLNPDVTMKDSGVEWLGEVPEHWEVKRIKHFGKVIGGFAFKSTDFTDEGYPVIKISNVSHLSFDWGDSSFLPPSFSFTHKEYLAPNGALVFAMTRPVISGGIKITLLDDDSAPLVNQRVGFMMVKSKNMARYILISTQSSAFLAQFVNNMTVTNQPNISSEGIESIYLPVPPMSEISRILLYVDRMNESYNQLIDKALLQVSLLQERRTALISAAVTGKIDVRGWVAPDTQDVEEPQEATA